MLRLSRRRTLAGCVVALTAAVASMLPASAQVAGAGAVQLTISINAPGLAPVDALACSPVTFSVSGNTQVAAVDVSGQTDYVGPLAVTGSGSSNCADVERNFFGFLNLSVNGSNHTGSVSCTNLAGDYIRVGAAVTVQVAGGCAINAANPTITLLASGIFQPTQGNGVTTWVTQGQYTGPFALVGD